MNTLPLSTMHRTLLLCASLLLAFGAPHADAQITNRARPKEWKDLVPGARFQDRFLPMPEGTLSADTWGAPNVIPRFVDNGIEDRKYSYWGGNILRGDDGKYHLFVCGWLESSPKGHFEWGNSIVFHATSDKPHGPFTVQQTIGKGHNPEAFRLKDGRYAIYVLIKNNAEHYIGDTINGPWTLRKLGMDTRDRRLIDGKSNLTFAQREDGTYLMVCRGGGIWFSQDGAPNYAQVTDRRVYPSWPGNYEDPVVWRDHVQYHLIVNDWLGRIAWYLRSKDGVKWVIDPGEAYTPGIARHADGTKEDWFKYERMKILQDKHGRAIQANFAVIDILKHHDKASDNHSSKNIAIPLNPGLLLTLQNKEPINTGTREIHLKITAEENFDPHTAIDIPSLRFGASSEVNFGRGAKAKSTQKDGPDLIVTFDATGHGITTDEFAPKLLGRDTKGGLLHGYARLPWVNYIEPILSARRPKFTTTGNSTTADIEIQNFGQVPPAQDATLTLEIKEGKTWQTLATTPIPPLKPFEKRTHTLQLNKRLEPGKNRDFRLTLHLNGNTHSTFELKAKP
jgi:hypothetical protein